MCGLDFGDHPNLLVGLSRPDDAGVYRLTDEIALVQTVDFFTPIVDDPFLFGQIAAANALSDVWAMGGKPITALNVVCFPEGDMGIGVLREILKGGLEKSKEASTPIVGGHTVKAPELKYGLSVTGVVHPDRIWGNAGARPGDRLILTKPLGTGIVTTAIKGDLASPEAVQAVTDSMCALNRSPAELAADLSVHACTDVTGFGLIGHGIEMISGSGCGLVIEKNSLPVFDGVMAYADMGLLPGGLHRNKKHYASRMEVGGDVPACFVDIICDPQTSGGLLFALSEADAAVLAERLRKEGLLAASIGTVVADRGERVTLA
jgi:selenide,water dikinase